MAVNKVDINSYQPETAAVPDTSEAPGRFGDGALRRDLPEQSAGEGPVVHNLREEDASGAGGGVRVQAGRGTRGRGFNQMIGNIQDAGRRRHVRYMSDDDIIEKTGVMWTNAMPAEARLSVGVDPIMARRLAAEIPTTLFWADLRYRWRRDVAMGVEFAAASFVLGQAIGQAWLLIPMTTVALNPVILPATATVFAVTAFSSALIKAYRSNKIRGRAIQEAIAFNRSVEQSRVGVPATPAAPRPAGMPEAPRAAAPAERPAARAEGEARDGDATPAEDPAAQRQRAEERVAAIQLLQQQIQQANIELNQIRTVGRADRIAAATYSIAEEREEVDQIKQQRAEAQADYQRLQTDLTRLKGQITDDMEPADRNTLMQEISDTQAQAEQAKKAAGLLRYIGKRMRALRGLNAEVNSMNLRLNKMDRKVRGYEQRREFIKNAKKRIKDLSNQA